MIDLVFTDSRADKEFGQKFFEDILKTGAEILDLDKKNIELSINLVSEAKIRELNKKYRQKDKVTDVLSFPLKEKLEIGNWKLEILDLGDIFICLPFAKKRAKMQNISIDKELAWLTIHGFLHLLGYDHERSHTEAEKMFDLESRILHRLGFD